MKTITIKSVKIEVVKVREHLFAPIMKAISKKTNPVVVRIDVTTLYSDGFTKKDKGINLMEGDTITFKIKI